MKNYIIFGIKINIAMFLAAILAGLALPLILTPVIMINPHLSDTSFNLISIIALPIIQFFITYLIFKKSYKNRHKKQIKSLSRAIKHSIIIFILLNAIYFYFTNEFEIISFCTYTTLTLLGFYLGGTHAIKKESLQN